jgi:predicted ATPase
MDEIDKSMDITNVIALYSEVLPRIAETAKCQMIIVSHSPIILTDNVYNSPHYNVISIDEEYTERCRKLLSNFSFGEEK